MSMYLDRQYIFILSDNVGAVAKRKDRVGKCIGARAGIAGQSIVEKDGEIRG